MVEKTKGRATDFDVHIGERLKLLRFASGLSQKDVAKNLEISFQQYQKYESGTNRISAVKLYALAQLMNVNIYEFFNGYGSDKKTAYDELKVLAPDGDLFVLLSCWQNIKSEQSKKSLLKFLKNFTKPK